MPGDDLFQRNSFSFAISRQMAVEEGLVEPTEAELEALRVRHAEFHATMRAEWAAYDVAVATYGDAVGGLDPLVRDVLELHSQDDDGDCGGCDFGGWESEAPSWPCRTATLIAERVGLELLPRPGMPREWAEGPLPEFRSPYPRRPIRDLFPPAFVSISGFDFGSKEED